MINAKIDITNLDYTASLGALLPKLIKIVSEKKGDGIVGRFLNCMGDDLVPFAQKVMGNMEDSEKEKLLLVLLHENRGFVRKLLTKFLSGTELGASVDVGKVDTYKETGKDGFSLLVSDVKIDYVALMDSGLVDRIAAKFGAAGGILKSGAKATRFIGKKAPNALEKVALTFLEQSSVNEKITKFVKGTLERFGLKMDVALSIAAQDGEAAEKEKVSEEFSIPQEAEDIVFAMLKRYMHSEA